MRPGSQPSYLYCTSERAAGLKTIGFQCYDHIKNEEITKLQQENIRTLKGSDLFLFMVTFRQNSKGEFPSMSINRTDLPVYNVYL